MIESECRSLQLMQLGGKVGDGAGWRLRHEIDESDGKQKGLQCIDDR